MKKENELLREIPLLVKATKSGSLKWNVRVQTTEYNAPEKKPVVMEDGIPWTVDECYVSFYCEYAGKEFLLITYEMIHTNEDRQKTTNLIFMPPLGIRLFDLDTLMPYALKNDQMLSYQVHMLYLSILEAKKQRPDQIDLDADERHLTIEEG